jgi:hypothetical protein
LRDAIFDANQFAPTADEAFPSVSPAARSNAPFDPTMPETAGQRPAIGNARGDASANSHAAARSAAPPDEWRYRWHQGHLWYYHSNGQWSYWNNNRWTTFQPVAMGQQNAAGGGYANPRYQSGYRGPMQGNRGPQNNQTLAPAATGGALSDRYLENSGQVFDPTRNGANDGTRNGTTGRAQGNSTSKPGSAGANTGGSGLNGAGAGATSGSSTPGRNPGLSGTGGLGTVGGGIGGGAASGGGATGGSAGNTSGGASGAGGGGTGAAGSGSGGSGS